LEVEVEAELIVVAEVELEALEIFQIFQFVVIHLIQ
jgi:hypothetical protein